MAGHSSWRIGQPKGLPILAQRFQRWDKEQTKFPRNDRYFRGRQQRRCRLTQFELCGERVPGVRARWQYLASLTTVPGPITFIPHHWFFPNLWFARPCRRDEVGSGCKTRAAAQLLTRTLPPVTGNSGKAGGVGWTLPRPYS